MTIEELENKTRARFKKSSTKTAQTSKDTSGSKSSLRTALAALKEEEEAKALTANNPAYAYAKANGTSKASPTTVVQGAAKTKERKPGEINAMGAGDYGASKKTKLDSTLNAATYNAAGSIANLFGLLEEKDAQTKARDEADSARLKAGREASEKGEDINTRAGGLKKQSEDSRSLFEKRYAELKGAGDKGFAVADELMQRAAEEENAAKAGLGKFGQGVVDFGIAGAQFAGDAIMNAFLPGSGLAAMGVRAAGGGAYDARAKGLDLDKQLNAGIKSAAIEVMTEKLFGAGSKIAYGKGWIKNENVVNGIVNRLAKTDKGRTALKVIAAANEEGLEEVLSDLLNPVADLALNLRDEDGNLIDDLSFEQMAEDYIIGAALGTFGSGANVASGQYKEENAQQRAKEDYQRALVEAAERADNSETVQKYKKIIDNSGKRGNRTLTDKETAELENIVYAPYVELRLDALGGKSSTETAKAIIKSARGEKLSKTEQEAFDENPYSQRVVNEMTEADTSNTWYTAMMNNVVYPEQREGFTPNVSEAQQVLEQTTQAKDAAAAQAFPGRAAQQRTASDIMADLANQQQVNAAQSIIEEGLSQPEGSTARIYANQLQEKLLEGETVTEEETAELNRLMTAPLDLEVADITENVQTENVSQNIAPKVQGGTGTASEKTQPTVIEEKEDTADERKQSADDSVGRKPDVGTGKQTGRIQEGTGRTEENKRAERSGEEAGRKNTSKAKRVSSREIGVDSGTDAKSLEVVHSDRLTPSTQRVMKAFEKAANGFVAVKGRIETGAGTVQGVTTADGKVIFRTDHGAYGATEILLHECGHLYIRDDSDMKKALKAACLESLSEKQLNELAMKYGELWHGVMSEDITDEEFFDYVLEEIYCDALAGIDRISARGASRLTEAVRGAFEEEAGIDIDALLNGTESGETAVTTEKGKAEDLPTRNNGPPSEKMSIETLPDGKKYVRADKQVIFGDDPELWSEQLERYINNKIRKGENVQLIAADGDVLMLTEDTAGKIASAYKDGRKMSTEEYERKASAGTHIDELARASTRGKTVVSDENARHGDKALYGWNYRTAYFEDFDGAYYKCTISVSIGKNGNAVYNIGKMQKRSFPATQKALSGSSAKSGAQGEKTSSENSIRGTSEKIKQKFSVDDAEGLKVRAAKMSVNTLRERLSRVEGMIRGYEMAENLSEAKQKELDKLRENRDIFKAALEEKRKKAKANAKDEKKAGREAAENMKKSPTAISKSAEKLTYSLLDTFNVSENRGQTRTFINATLEQWRQRGHFTKKDVDKLEDVLLENGTVRVTPNDTAAEVRSYIYSSRMYVSPEVVAELGDEWDSIRKRAFGAGIYLTSKNINAGGIDSHYMELQGAFGYLFREETDLTEMLRQMVNMAEDGKSENMSLSEYASYLEKTERSGDDYLEYMHNKLMEELKSFSNSAKVEMRVKTGNAYAQAKDRARRRRVELEAQERKELAELQRNTLKQLQYVEKNLMKVGTGDEESKKLKAEMEKILDGINLITIKTADEMRYSDKYEATWKDLSKMYAEAREKDPNWLPNKELDKIMGRVNDKSLEEMTPSDLRNLYQQAVALNTAYHNRNNMKNDDLHRTYADVANDTVDEIATAQKPKNRFGKRAQHTREALNPIHFLEYLTGWNPDSVFTNTLAKGLEDGERKMRRYQEEANQMLDNFLENNREWVRTADGQGKDGVWYEYEVPELLNLEFGKKPEFGQKRKVYMTPMQKVMLALESKSYDNLAHMAGGRTFANKELYQKGDFENAFAQEKPIALAPETVKDMVKNLTPQEQELYDILAKYYNDFAKERINKTSNVLYGYDKAMSSFYVPITTNSSYTQSTPGIYDVTAEGAGSLKKRIYGAKNPTLNISAVEAFRRHVSQMSRFVGLAIPIENMNRVLNWYAGDETVKGVISREWSSKDLKYVNDIMTELQSSTHMEQTELENWLGKIESGYIGATFAVNPSVALKVFGSWCTAMGSLNPKYAKSSLSKADDKLISKYTSELDIRKRGYSTPELAQMRLNEGKINRAIQSNIVTKDVFGGGWMIRADIAVARSLWSWAEAQIKAETDLKPGTQEQINSGTDEFYKAVAKKFEEAIGNTQSMYDVMHRSKLMKAGGAMRAVTMFHTDTMQCYNILKKNIGEAEYYKKASEAAPDNEELKKKASAARESASAAINGVVLCSLEVAIVSVLNSILKRRDKYEDEDGKFDWREVGSEFVSSFLQGFTGMLPGYDVALNAVTEFALGGKVYDVQLPGLSLVNDLIQSAISLGDKVRSGKELTAEDAKDIALKVAKAAGLPIENIEKYIMGILSWVSPSIAQAYDDMLTPPKKSDLNELDGAALERAVYDKIKDYGVSKETAAVLAELYENGYTKAVPGDVPEKITVDGEETVLSKKDVEKYNETLAETLSKLDEVVNSTEFKEADNETKEKMLRRVNEFAHASAKKAVNDNYDMPAWAQSAQDLIDMDKGIMSVAAMPYSGKKASSSSESEDNRFTKLVKGGIEYNDAADIERTIQEIEPSNGKSVRDVDKLIAIAEMPIGEDEKDIAFSLVLGERMYKEYKTATAAGALSYQYADFQKALERINDNSSVSQAEFEAAVEESNLPAEAARQMWYARGWKKESPWG